MDEALVGFVSASMGLKNESEPDSHYPKPKPYATEVATNGKTSEPGLNNPRMDSKSPSRVLAVSTTIGAGPTPWVCVSKTLSSVSIGVP